MRPQLTIALLFAAAAHVACGGEASPSASSGGALPCDVDAVLARSCRECHGATPSFGAPMPLVTLSDLHAPARSDASKKVYELVGARVHDDAHPMPQPPNARLSGADVATLDAWIASGAPGGTCDGGVSASPDSGPPLSCTPDLHVAPTSAFTLPEGVDEEYVCYGFEATSATKRHIIAMAPRIDNHAILHHLTLLQSDAPVSATPAACPLSGSTSYRPVFGWAPGGKSFELPKEAGFALDSTTHFVVQMHLSNASHAPNHADASGFDLCTTETLRPNDADVMAFGTTAIAIPARASLDLDCSVAVPSWGATTHLFAAFPHMHKLGTSISTVAHPGGGASSVDLGTQPAWNFGEQGWIPIDYVLLPGDTVETKCAWTNPTDSAVTYGEGTGNEMCFSFEMYYPKITASVWNWAAPIAYTTCK